MRPIPDQPHIDWSQIGPIRISRRRVDIRPALVEREARRKMRDEREPYYEAHEDPDLELERE